MVAATQSISTINLAKIQSQIDGLNTALGNQVSQVEASENEQVEDATAINTNQAALGPVSERENAAVQIRTTIGRYAYTGQLSPEQAMEIYRSISNLI